MDEWWDWETSLKGGDNDDDNDDAGEDAGEDSIQVSWEPFHSDERELQTLPRRRGSPFSAKSSTEGTVLTADETTVSMRSLSDSLTLAAASPPSPRRRSSSGLSIGSSPAVWRSPSSTRSERSIVMRSPDDAGSLRSCMTRRSYLNDDDVGGDDANQKAGSNGGSSGSFTPIVRESSLERMRRRESILEFGMRSFHRGDDDDFLFPPFGFEDNEDGQGKDSLRRTSLHERMKRGVTNSPGTNKVKLTVSTRTRPRSSDIFHPSTRKLVISPQQRPIPSSHRRLSFESLISVHDQYSLTPPRSISSTTMKDDSSSSSSSEHEIVFESDNEDDETGIADNESSSSETTTPSVTAEGSKKALFPTTFHCKDKGEDDEESVCRNKEGTSHDVSARFSPTFMATLSKTLPPRRSSLVKHDHLNPEVVASSSSSPGTPAWKKRLRWQQEEEGGGGAASFPSPTGPTTTVGPSRHSSICVTPQSAKTKKKTKSPSLSSSAGKQKKKAKSIGSRLSATESEVLAAPTKKKMNQLMADQRRNNTLLTWTKTKPVDNFSDHTICIIIDSPFLAHRDGDENYALQGEVYHVHKCIVGIGPRGSGYLLEDMRQQHGEDQSGKHSTTTATTIKLNRKTARVFPTMLDYMYSFNAEPLRITNETAISLKKLAKFFVVPTMFDEVTRFLQSKDSGAMGKDGTVESKLKTKKKKAALAVTAAIGNLPF